VARLGALQRGGVRHRRAASLAAPAPCVDLSRQPTPGPEKEWLVICGVRKVKLGPGVRMA